MFGISRNAEQGHALSQCLEAILRYGILPLYSKSSSSTFPRGLCAGFDLTTNQSCDASSQRGHSEHMASRGVVLLVSLAMNINTKSISKLPFYSFLVGIISYM